ncbi:hypothetical protein ANANG_G00314230 [Anguilla anguilla]|uniref:Death domain-containing protein n=1 Tax=Anguilla anguilla TaxID=7936 RepID=A0A9D3LIN9_ANGAN|nr:hypothetical protein ANANG_G00314230 [Anguilla anguilla]
MRALHDSCGISEEVLRKVPSDKELNRLSGLLGPEWESVLLDLGVSACQLFRCRADHPHSLQSQVLAGLMVWRQSRGRSATFRQLLQSLRAAQIHPSVIEQVFRQEGGEGDLAHCPKGSGKTAPIL